MASEPYMCAHQSQYSDKIKESEFQLILESMYTIHETKLWGNIHDLHLNLANVERGKLVSPPKAKKVKGKPKGDTNVMELFRSSFMKMY